MKSSSSRELRARNAGRVFRDELAVDDPRDGIGRILQNVIVALEVRFVEAPLDARAEHLGGVAGDFAAEQVAGDRCVEVGNFALQERQVDHAELAHRLDFIGILDAGFDHRRAGRLDRALDAGLADEHVVRLFGQHEPAGA